MGANFNWGTFGGRHFGVHSYPPLVRRVPYQNSEPDDFIGFQSWVCRYLDVSSLRN